MKKIILKSLVITTLALIAPAVLSTGCSDERGTEKAEGKQIYYCPMHPEVQSDKPGVCPICHMDLVLKNNGGDDMAEHSDDLLQLSGRKEMLANVAVVPVRKENILREITAFSYLDFAEQNRKSLTAKFSGRIEKLYADRTGEYIRKGERLFEVYSPDLVQAQNDFLIAAGKLNLLTEGKNPGGENPLLKSARQKLLIMGMSEDQVNELERSQKVNLSVVYHSPYSGTIIDKKVREGMYINEGTALYEVAELSELWSIAEVFADDISLITPGSRVQLKVASYPGRIFEGVVDLVYPVIDSRTRTLKIRSVFRNSGNILKPNMYGETIFPVNLGEGLVVPSEAVIFTGEKNIVWVQPEKGKFEIREIRTGYKTNGGYQVLSGLKEGELVASEGAYLIDSESQLKSGLNAPGHREHQDPGEMKGKKEEEKNHDSHSSLNKEIFNKYCPVLGSPVQENSITIEYKGKNIGFCCPGCDKEFLADPEKYMKNLSPDGKKFIKNS